ncbi:helix-turn-helix domain-containing protein [Pseudophaeobacter sp.]|uniref:helix-turn-helix domain-containing protein n=1 Tax=Pseudophaeobacter sp. TaxID=1971739 RepID=UPI00405A49CA
MTKPTPKPAARETQAIIGQRMRELRKAKGLTLKQLAASTDLSIGYLSQLERQDADPSIRALNVIGKALGVGINWFFPDPDAAENPETGYVVRADRRRALRFASGLRDELLSPSLAGQLEMVLTTFEPGASSGEELYSHKGEEAGFVVEGQLEITLDDQVFLLGPGDTIQFPSERPHRYRNPGPGPTRLIWAVTPPHY